MERKDILKKLELDCTDPVVSPREYVSHEMALDAENRELEGQIYKEETWERCGTCPNCMFNQIKADLIAEAELMEKASGGVEDLIAEQMGVYFMVNDTFLVHKFELPNQVNDGLVERHNKRQERLAKLLSQVVNAHWAGKMKGIEKIKKHIDLAIDFIKDDANDSALFQLKEAQALTNHLTEGER